MDLEIRPIVQKPIEDSGRELDALYSVELSEEGFDLIVESRGGSDHGPNPARNSDYAVALEQHLSRMGAFGMVLLDVQVASRVAMDLPEVSRRISLDNFAFPLALSSISDVRALRLSIGRASAAFGRSDGSDRGNRTKRMRFSLDWQPALGMTSDALERLLSRPPRRISVELPTSDPEELQVRVRNAIASLRAAIVTGEAPAPTGQTSPTKTIGSSSRFVRDPNVIAWVLNEAAGICEVCGSLAPFLRSDGEPCLEVHHVRPLGEGGPDPTDNAVSCCPNCHRKLHHGSNREKLRTAAISAIPRLKNYPPAE